MRPKTKKSEYLGMTKAQIVIVAILGIVCCILITTLAGMIYYTTQPIPTPMPLPTSTPMPINAFIDIAIDTTQNKFRPLIKGKTNLPDGTIIMVSVEGINVDFSGQDRVLVSSGTFTAGPFGVSLGLEEGSYKVEALMPIPEVQSEEVRQVIGNHGENITGSQIIRDGTRIVVTTEKKFDIFIPTSTPTPKPTLTPSPRKDFISGGGIGKMWSNDIHSIGLANVYKTDTIDGEKPFGERLGGYRGGYTEFIVVELQLQRFSPGYEDFALSDFWLSSYSDNEYLEYKADIFPYQEFDVVRVYYQEKTTVSIAFEVMPSSHNFILCYQTSVGIDSSGKIKLWCGANGYEFKFGD
jgi:hypothetical protein